MTAQTVNPRKVVEAASLTLLMHAYSDALGLHMIDDGEGDVRVICPQCAAGPHRETAQLLPDGWRWHCWSCRFRGTRAVFERLVLENADALELLFELRDEVPE